jgi:hypothetical protein
MPLRERSMRTRSPNATRNGLLLACGPVGSVDSLTSEVIFNMAFQK